MPRAMPFSVNLSKAQADLYKIHHPLWSMLKRTVDIAGALVGFVVFLPAFILLMILIPLDGGPALYAQTRIGKNGKAFKCWKFRSMVPSADNVLQKILATNESLQEEWRETRKLAQDPRITKLGDFIRKTSLDEIPQFYNILRGEMSLIGPRPVTRAEMHHYGVHAKTYQNVKPGLTGLWQVKGRNKLSYQKRVNLDVYYIRNWSLWLDIAIVLKTIYVVCTRRGAY